MTSSSAEDRLQSSPSPSNSSATTPTATSSNISSRLGAIGVASEVAERSIPTASNPVLPRADRLSPDRNSHGTLTASQAADLEPPEGTPLPAPASSPTARLPQYKIPPMPEPANDPPPSSSWLKPLDIILLLRCCYCNALLDTPTTLRCGHTVCSIHVTLGPNDDQASSPSHVLESVRLTRTVTSSSHTSTSSDASSSRAPPMLADLPSCPLQNCAPPPSSTRLSSAVNLPLNSSVQYYPSRFPAAEASTTSLQSTASGSSSSRNPDYKKKVPSPKVDITVAKILQLSADCIREKERRHRARAREEHRDPLEDEAGPSSISILSQVSTSPSIVSRRSSQHHSRSPTPDTHVSDNEGSPLRKPLLKRQKTAKEADQQSTVGEDDEPPADPLDLKFAKQLFAEVQCEICFSLLWNPATTPCQHTFCSKCLSRTLDHGTLCPLCRQELPGYAYFHDQPPNRIVGSIILHAFSQAHADRTRAIQEEERSARLDTPIFVCTLAFPGLPTILHVFEPRYRLMLRRCLESQPATFGMITPPRTNAPPEAEEYGTMLEIHSVQMFPDGRSMVETRGTYRFRIVEKGYLDGYMVARIERIDDVPPEAEELLKDVLATAHQGTEQEVEPSIEELMAVCRDFYEQLRGGTAPWVVEQLNNAYGAMPEDPSTFSFWMAMLLPIDENEKAKMLAIRSTRLRLRLLVHWIESLNNSWWFGQGCIIS